MRADRLQEDRLGTLMLDKLENDPRVVPNATGPRTLQLSFEFVGLERGIESVFREQFQSTI
jgi:hypothetical protein